MSSSYCRRKQLKLKRQKLWELKCNYKKDMMMSLNEWLIWYIIIHYIFKFTS